MPEETGFYSPNQQFFRTVRNDLRLHGVDILFGVLYAIGGFYFFRRLGYSQVYDVIVPFVAISGALLYLTQRICELEATRRTAVYSFSLPRAHTVAWDAHVSVLMGTAAGLVACIFVGAWLKLGGASITPVYRLHPELVVLPFFSVSLVIWNQHSKPSLKHYCLLAALLVLVVGIGVVEIEVFSRNLVEHPGHIPPRGVPILAQFLVAAFLASLTVTLLFVSRQNWVKRQIGEIR